MIYLEGKHFCLTRKDAVTNPSIYSLKINECLKDVSVNWKNNSKMATLHAKLN